MAYDPNELYESEEYPAYPRIGPKRVLPCTFSGDAAAPELAVGTPVAFNEDTLFWEVWSASGTGDVDEIKGFIYPDAVQLHETDEVIAQVMVKGDIHWHDVVVPEGESAAALAEAIRTQCLLRDLVVRGITEVR